MERWGAPSRAGELAGESLLPPRRRLLQPAAEANARAPSIPRIVGARPISRRCANSLFPITRGGEAHVDEQRVSRSSPMR